MNIPTFGAIYWARNARQAREIELDLESREIEHERIAVSECDFLVTNARRQGEDLALDHFQWSVVLSDQGRLDLRSYRRSKTAIGQASRKDLVRMIRDLCPGWRKADLKDLAKVKRAALNVLKYSFLTELIAPLELEGQVYMAKHAFNRWGVKPETVSIEASSEK